MGKAVKFSHIYHSSQDRVISFEDIEQIYNKNPELYQTQYHGYLYCPQCRVPQMVYCNADPPYIRVYPNQMHSTNCDHFHPPLLKKELEEACKDSENINSFNHRLNYLLRSLINEDKPLEKAPQVQSIIKNNRNVKSIKKQRTNQHYVPPRKLVTPIKDYDLGIVKHYYGDVALKVTKTWWNGCFIDVESVDGKSLFCSLALSSEVYKKLLDIKNKENCKVAFTTVLDYSGETYGRNKRRYIRGAVTKPELFCFFDQNSDKHPEEL